MKKIFNYAKILKYSALEFEYFHIFHHTVFYLEPQCRTDYVPSLDPGGPGVDVQQIPAMVSHDLEDVGMAADEDVRPVGVNQGQSTEIVMVRRTSDVYHQDFLPLHLKELILRIFEADILTVAVAGNAHKGLECLNLFGETESATEISCMPYHVHRLEEFPEAFAECAVGV